MGGRAFRESGATVDVEDVSATNGHLAHTVAIQRSLVQFTDSVHAGIDALRVTHIFRTEAGEWKLVDRHADLLIGTTAPAAALK